MNEGEKEAIEQLKSWRDYIIKYKGKVNKANDLEFYIRTVLNLITKLQKQNEKLNLMIAKSTAQRVLTDIKHSKKSNEDLEMLAKGYDIEIQKLQKENEKYKYLYQKVLDNTVSSDHENIELKKQIDLMAEYWSAGLAICDECEYIVEAYTKDNCKDCIKQYFEKLAKESRG